MKTLLNSASYLTLAAFAPPGESEPGAGDPPEAGAGDPPAGGEGGDPPKAGAGDPPAGDEGAGDPPAAAAKPATDWRDREIARKHRKLQEETRERERLERELADANALLERRQDPAVPDPAAAPAARTTAPAPRALTADDPAVQEAAKRITAQTEFTNQCNTAFDDGKKRFSDKWDGALAQIEQLGGLGGVEGLTGILATDDPAKVMFALGSNPDEYHRIMDLPPAKRLAEFVKLGLPAAKPPAKKPSDAPEPVAPVGGRRVAADAVDNKLRDDKTPDDEWYAIRKEQKARRFAARNGKAA